jgi:hypothetical protein
MKDGLKLSKRRRWRLIKSKITSQRFRDSAQIYNSGRIPGATDKGMTTEAHYLSTPRIRSGRGPWKLGPSIVIVEIWDHTVTRIVICIEPDRFLRTWPPINMDQERPTRTDQDWAKIDSNFTFNTQYSLCLCETLPLSSSDVLFPQS